MGRKIISVLTVDNDKAFLETIDLRNKNEALKRREWSFSIPAFVMPYVWKLRTQRKKTIQKS